MISIVIDSTEWSKFATDFPRLLWKGRYSLSEISLFHAKTGLAVLLFENGCVTEGGFFPDAGSAKEFYKEAVPFKELSKHELLQHIVTPPAKPAA